MGKTIYVTFFGRFALSCAPWGTPGTIVAQGRASRRLWSFLQYLCAFHQKGASQEELIDAIWGEAEVTDPVGALKTILHRARTLLEELGFPDGKKLLLYRRGYYSWAPEVEFCLDTEELDRLYAGFAAAPEETLPMVLEFLPRYEEDFLGGTEGSSWALSLRTFYHTRYLQLSWGAAKLLQAKERFDEAIGICRTATTLDPYDERCQLLLIRLLHACGTVQAALRHYRTVSELYMNQLGVSPSPEMLALYQDICRAGSGEKLELDGVREQLREKGNTKGPFFCEYAVFQDMYRLTARSISRSGGEAQVALLTLEEDVEVPLDAIQRSAAMAALRDKGLSGLRAEDIVGRVNPSQLLLLLRSASRQDAENALKRILSSFERTLVGKSVGIQVSLLPVLPADGWEEGGAEG